MLEQIARFAENAWLHLVCGLVLIISGGAETLRTLEAGELGAHHGILFFGLVQSLKSLPNLLHGAEQIVKAGKG